MRRVQEVVANLKKDPVIARGTAEGLLRVLQYDGFAGLTHLGVSPTLGPTIRPDSKSVDLNGDPHKLLDANKYDTLLNVVISHLVHYGINTNNRRNNEEGYDKFITTLTHVLLIYVRTSSDYAKHFLEYYPECIVMLLELCSTKGAKSDLLADNGLIHTALQVLHALCVNVKRALVLLRSEDGVQNFFSLLNSINEKNRTFKSPKLVEVLLDVLSAAVTRTDTLTSVAKLNGFALLFDIAKKSPPTAMFTSLLNLLDALFKSDRIIKQAIDMGFVHWLLFALRGADVIHVPFLLRHLKDMVRISTGYHALMSEGGFDVMLPQLGLYFFDSACVQAACGVLFELQKQCSALGGDAYIDIYNLAASGFTVKLPATIEKTDVFDPFDLCMELWDPCSAVMTKRAADFRAEVRNAPIRTLAKFCCTGPIVDREASRMCGPEELYRPSQGLRVEAMHCVLKRLLSLNTVATVVYDRQSLEHRSDTDPSQIYAPSPRSTTHLPRFHDDSSLPHPLKTPKAHRVSEPPLPSSVASTAAAGSSRNFLSPEDPRSSVFLRRTLSCPAKMFSSPRTSSPLPCVTMSEGGTGLPPLRFDSRFESGNLHRAVQVGEAEYDLILSTDVNSKGYTQWFYFLVQNGIPGFTYKFNIVNLEKSDSVFSEGMKPCVFSSEAYLRSGIGWSHDMLADNICYHRNYYRRPYDKVTGKQVVPGGGNNSNGGRAKKMKRNSCGVDTDEEETATEEMKDVNGDQKKNKKKKVVKKKRRRDADDPDFFYTLSFCVKFPYANDTVYYAYSYPFTFSYLRSYLDFIEVNSGHNIIRRQPLCYTRGGNLVEMLTITEFATHTSQLAEVRKRPLVVLTSRVHPGETNASWVMKGFLDWICGSSNEAIELRKNVVFKIVPMLNPDGVIEGNYRCNLAGLDLNRCWSLPDPDLSPAIYATKRMIHSLCSKPGRSASTSSSGVADCLRVVAGNGSMGSGNKALRPLLFMCDIHGHSKMKDFCLYGCDWKLSASEYWPSRLVGVANAQQGGVEAPPNLPPGCMPLYSGAEKVFPYLLTQRAPQLFSFLNCKFNVTEDKASTARVVLWHELELSQCFTLETTFCTVSKGPLQGFHLSQFHFEEMGLCVGRALLDLVVPGLKSALLEPCLDRNNMLHTLIGKATALQSALEAEALAEATIVEEKKLQSLMPHLDLDHTTSRGERRRSDTMPSGLTISPLHGLPHPSPVSTAAT